MCMLFKSICFAISPNNEKFVTHLGIALWEGNSDVLNVISNWFSSTSYANLLNNRTDNWLDQINDTQIAGLEPFDNTRISYLYFFLYIGYCAKHVKFIIFFCVAMYAFVWKQWKYKTSIVICTTFVWHLLFRSPRITRDVTSRKGKYISDLIALVIVFDACIIYINI